MLFSVLFTVVYAISGISVEFNLAARDILLVYFSQPSASMPVSKTCWRAANH